LEFQKDFRVNETLHVLKLVDYLSDCKYFLNTITPTTIKEIEDLRKTKFKAGGIDLIMKYYPMHKNEFVGLMGMAESLIRIPDKATAYKLLADKVDNRSWLVANFFSITIAFYSFGLFFAKKILKINKTGDLHKLSKFFAPFIYIFAKKMMFKMSLQFIVATNMQKALKRVNASINNNIGFSFDMLGEAARTNKDADKYYKDYTNCLYAIKDQINSVKNKDLFSISVKLTSLCPRYEPTQINNSFDEIYNKLLNLCLLAKDIDIPLFVDAEETDKLEFSFKMFEKILQEPELQNWTKFAIVLQAYQKRAFHAIDFLYNTAKNNNRKILIRLVKGAYWDSEIKNDQINGVSDYALFTKKEHTDISYMACAKKLSTYTDVISPCFATHNVHTINFVKQIMGSKKYEFQYLFGMGEDVYKTRDDVSVRVYAPVGDVKTVLPYLIRRLLENGAKYNFMNCIVNTEISPEQLAQNPIEIASKHGFSSNKFINSPSNIYISESRLNSKGIDMADLTVNKNLQDFLLKYTPINKVKSIINGVDEEGDESIETINPSNLQKIAEASIANTKQMDKAMEVANSYQPTWNSLGGAKRADILEKTANILEDKIQELVAVLSQEAGKTIKDCIAEVREAVDFLRYYGYKAREEFSSPVILPSIDGEKNSIILEGRGVFLCISPWNFPLAIFLGQISAALAAGNTVVAKPAESTNIIAYMAVKIFLEAGLPKEALHLIISKGKPVGDYLTQHQHLSGVVFTGSTATAQYLNKQLASREDYILPLIAETGGLNCMIVDSTALSEQVARDVISSAFYSAGQRCSCLRVLYLADNIADEYIAMIKGAAELINIGEPWNIETDVGPIINSISLDKLNKHKKDMTEKHKLLFQLNLNTNLKGHFFAPCAFEIKSINDLKEETFGPILHVIRYKEDDLENIIKDINATKYGLTFGLHTRIDSKVNHIAERINAGNVYVNRNQIGAIVGSQPFGGRGKSGTGPKAGGPHYLHKFANEKVITIDITATGGNRDLLNK
jgi:RHH-type proline utilization regulon transcriptional repressor/proline dehydrogenase/delta 1-pyrroline-5-carboxylate dehydrogenase